jgi:capsular polysaccharide biosynthesis protein
VELRRYLTLLKQRRLLVVVIVLAALAGSYLASSRTPMYRGQATIYVGLRGLPLQGASADLQTGQQAIAQTFANMVATQPVATEALAATHISRSADTVIKNTKATVIAGTSLIKLTYDDHDPAAAQALTNLMAQSFISQIQRLDPPTVPAGSNGPPPSLANVFESARLPVSPQPNGVARNVVLGLLFGLLAAVGLVLLLDYLDLTVKGPEDLERRLDLPVLGTIPLQRQLSAGLSPLAFPRHPSVSAPSHG